MKILTSLRCLNACFCSAISFYCCYRDYLLLLFFLLYIIGVYTFTFWTFSLRDDWGLFIIMVLHIDFLNVGIFLLQQCGKYLFWSTLVILFFIYYCQYFFIRYIFIQKISGKQGMFYLCYLLRLGYFCICPTWLTWTPKFNRALYFKRK